jgi:moderate conductance mechanosensitive channel
MKQNGKTPKTKEEKKALIKKIVIWSLCIAVVLIALFSKQLFGSNLYGDDANGFIAIGDWFQLNALNFLKTALLVLGIWMLITIMKGITKLLSKRSQKVRTVASLSFSLLKWLLIFVALFVDLGYWGVDTASLLASIGVIALIIGLGCESLISDVVAGLFLVFDDTFEVGDIVVIEDYRGTVKEIGLKSTQLLDAGGNVKIINNSDITDVVNLSDELSVAICDDCDISYNEDLRRVEAIIARELPNVKKEIPAIVDGPYYKGVSEFYRDGPLLKFVARCKEDDVYQVTRDMKKWIFKMLDDNGVDVPYPQYYVSQAADESAYEEATPKQVAKAEAFTKAQAEASKDIEPVNGTK